MLASVLTVDFHVFIHLWPPAKFGGEPGDQRSGLLCVLLDLFRRIFLEHAASFLHEKNTAWSWRDQAVWLKLICVVLKAQLFG
jgi:hypothetical protein